MTRDRQRILLSAIDNALRNGSYMTGANLALDMLCEDLGEYRDQLPAFEPKWARTLPDACSCGKQDCPWNAADRARRADAPAVDHHARLAAGTEWVCGACGYHNNGGICTHCGQVPLADHPGECPFPDDSCRSLPTCPADSLAAGTEER